MIVSGCSRVILEVNGINEEQNHIQWSLSVKKLQGKVPNPFVKCR